MSKRYQVKEVSRLSGVTVRTLHHYDRIGLLTPSGRTDAGYRLYGDAELLRLQQILLYRELGFPLERIREILAAPDFDPRGALVEQRRVLLSRIENTEAMVRAIDLALDAIDGGEGMDAKQLFDGFDPAKHEDEVRERWGGTDAYAEAARRTKRYSRDDWKRIKTESDRLLADLAGKLAVGASPTDDEVVELAEEHRLQIDRWYYPCSRAMHAALAEMYVSDPRFEASFDRHGEGLAEFLAEAIRANATRGGD